MNKSIQPRLPETFGDYQFIWYRWLEKVCKCLFGVGIRNHASAWYRLSIVKPTFSAIRAITSSSHFFFISYHPVLRDHDWSWAASRFVGQDVIIQPPVSKLSSWLIVETSEVSAHRVSFATQYPPHARRSKMHLTCSSCDACPSTVKSSHLFSTYTGNFFSLFALSEVELELAFFYSEKFYIV